MPIYVKYDITLSRVGGKEVSSYELRVSSYELRVSSFEYRVSSFALMREAQSTFSGRARPVLIINGTGETVSGREVSSIEFRVSH